MNPRRACITSLGRHVPEKVVTNADLAKIVDTSDEWIRTRTGIEERHVVEKGTGTSVIAAHAARECLERAGVEASEVDLIIVATVTPDMPFPATACLVQDRIKATRAWGFDVNAACSGFPYALDRGRAVRGDGGGAQGAGDRRRRDDGHPRLHGALHLRALRRRRGGGAPGAPRGRHGHPGFPARGGRDAAAASSTCRPGAASTPRPTRRWTRRCTASARRGRPSSSSRCASSPRSARTSSSATTWRAGELDLFVPHQANLRIIDAARDRLGLPDEKVVKNIRHYGNTTAATIPLALGTALDQKRLQAGDLVLLAAVGAGFTVGTVLVRWSGVPWD